MSSHILLAVCADPDATNKEAFTDRFPGFTETSWSEGFGRSIIQS